MKTEIWQLVVVIFLCGFWLSSCAERTILTDRSSIESASIKTAKAECGKVWFVKVSDQGNDLVSVVRSVPGSRKMEFLVKELLTGPNAGESEKGIGSEIPLGTILLGIKENADDIELNLSKRFTAGGGAVSFQTRLDQLIATVSPAAEGKNVYLDVEGERLTTTQGDGLEVKQPINK